MFPIPGMGYSWMEMTQTNPFSPYQGFYRVQAAALDSNLSAAQEREATRWVRLTTPDPVTVEVTEFALHKGLLSHRLKTKESFVRNQRPKLEISSSFGTGKEGEILLTDRYQHGKDSHSLSEFRLKELPSSNQISLSILEENRHFEEHQRFLISFTLKKLSRLEVFLLKFVPSVARFF